MKSAMRLIPILVLLAACHSPGPHFRGVPAKTVVVAGSTFDVRIRDSLGEAIRTNVQYAPRFGRLANAAIVAIEQVSGCKVKKILGDQAHALGTLDCGTGALPDVPIYRGHNEAECFVIDQYVSPATDELVLELDCDPVF